MYCEREYRMLEITTFFLITMVAVYGPYLNSKFSREKKFEIKIMKLKINPPAM